MEGENGGTRGASTASGAGDPPIPELETDSRPEVVRNRQMATLRSDFAAGNYAAVAQRTRDILATDPARDDARMYLTMAACALGDQNTASEQLTLLPASRVEFAKRRCQGFGMSL